MEPQDLLQLKEILPYLTWPVVAALGIYYVVRPLTDLYVRRSTIKKVTGKSIETVTDEVAIRLRENHLHDWGDDLKSLKKSVAAISVNVNINSKDIANIKGWLKGKFNGTAKDL